MLSELSKNKEDCSLIFDLIKVRGGEVLSKVAVGDYHDINLYGNMDTRIIIYLDGTIHRWRECECLPVQVSLFKIVDLIRSLGYEPNK